MEVVGQASKGRVTAKFFAYLCHSKFAEIFVSSTMETSLK